MVWSLSARLTIESSSTRTMCGEGHMREILEYKFKVLFLSFNQMNE